MRILLSDPGPAVRRALRAALGRHDILNVLEADGLDEACARAPERMRLWSVCMQQVLPALSWLH